MSKKLSPSIAVSFNWRQRSSGSDGFSHI